MPSVVLHVPERPGKRSPFCMSPIENVRSPRKSRNIPSGSSAASDHWPVNGSGGVLEQEAKKRKSRHGTIVFIRKPLTSLVDGRGFIRDFPNECQPTITVGLSDDSALFLPPFVVEEVLTTSTPLRPDGDCSSMCFFTRLLSSSYSYMATTVSPCLTSVSRFHASYLQVNPPTRSKSEGFGTVVMLPRASWTGSIQGSP